MLYDISNFDVLFVYSCLFFFFFSSRRRHTRWTGDWSSDVCSSDLQQGTDGHQHRTDRDPRRVAGEEAAGQLDQVPWRVPSVPSSFAPTAARCPRSEERRVGKECRSRWSTDD